MKSLFLSLALAMACAITKAQAPPNDNACQATLLTAGTTCSYQTFSTENATASTGSAVPNCANFVSGATGDVWFRVTVPASGSLTIDTQEGTITDGGMAVYRGNSCLVLTLLACDDNSSTNGTMPALTTTGLVPGTTVYIRFWENGGDNNGTFGICVTIPPAAPSNDGPCNATQLTAGTDCVYQTFTTESATNTTSVPPPVCAGYLGGDVWFRVIVPATGSVSIDTQEGTVIDGGMAVYSGTDCGGTLTQLACDDNSSDNGSMPALNVNNQPPGSTLWVRFWEYGNNNNGTFGICVRNLETPSNDEPCNAIQLTVGADCNYQTFSTETATATIVVPGPGCANYTGGDVWFKVTVPADGQLFFDTDEGTITDGGMAVYSGTDCGGSLILLACDDNSSANGQMPALTISNQPPGSILWVRFWENGGDNNGTFGICIKTVPPPPSNDNPCNAVQLTVGTVCNYQIFTTENATDSPGAPLPECAGYYGSDVWFKVIVPSGSSGLLFDSQPGVITDGGMAVYTGTDCNTLTLIDCDDDASLNGRMPALSITNQPPGSTLWVRFWEYGNDNNGTFGICVKNARPPSNDKTCSAIPLPVNTVCNYEIYTTEDATDSQGVPLPGCANYIGGDVWFTVTVPAEGGLFFDTRTGVITDGGMAVYTGNDCDSLTLIACDDNASVNGSMPALSITNQPPGSTLWVRFWENGGNNNGTFGICVRVLLPPVNDNPCNAIQLIVDSVCNYQIFTTEGATASPGVPLPGCANYSGGDVWFKVTVPESGSLFFDSEDRFITDGGLALYTGPTCDSLTLLSCDDDASVNGTMPALAIENQPPGTTLWVRFWEYGGNSNGTFGICVKKPSSLWADIIYTKYPVDFGNVIQYTDISATLSGFPIVSWHWDFGDGDTSNLQNPVRFTNYVGPVTVTLTIKNTNNQYQTKIGYMQLAIYVPYILQISVCSSTDSAQISTPVLTGNVQWQMSTDSVNFTNINDNINFRGTNTPVLTLRNIPSTWIGRLFRCSSDEGYYSWKTAIKFGNEFTNVVSSNWEDLANWSCGSLPDANTDVIINGIATLNSNASCRSLQVKRGATFTISPGYNLTVTQQ